ncbi:hypothetical protein Q8G28_17570 [Lysinibacillus capsici]|uniref:hypothetical protein n=1 Tax=Lysinibacillus capsici TaxID=2115968 RepID=UPI00272EF19B|nr:hypothetical protein [Lysinibacillus capsici]MDP1395302.1 hypothetical protein [Lysinibacillus capsici]MDP1415767.1 hypothetical protein [Lysinibacillus capsici]MDP1431553.1 hypothetical protein [Lysinibacillus capsici]
MSFEFDYSVHEYAENIRRSIINYGKYFENAWNVKTHLKLKSFGSNLYSVKLDTHQILKAGDKIDPSEHALVFKDGSILSIAQMIEVLSSKKCRIHTSVVTFVKTKFNYDTGDTIVEYAFHYDKVNNVPNHPDFHLQFDYNQTINTPRFEVHKYVDIDEILRMIVRDQLV